MQSLLIAFAMYSRIPVPQINFDKEGGKYAFCFFPLIGIIIGVLELAAYKISIFLGLGTLFRAALLTALPVVITGGIHLDGFIDTVDARSSYGDREKKLAILKDPHAGAFAIIYGALYLLVSLGAWSQADWTGLCIMALFFGMERAASALAAFNFKEAGSGSSLDYFTADSRKMLMNRVLVIWFVLLLIAMGFIWLPGALAAFFVTAFTAARYHHIAMKEFGGIRGDLAGWFLQNLELTMLIVLAFLEKIIILIS